ncbi:acetyl CoA synthetase subunit alpha, partial [Aduncisulcus paluster]
MDAIFKPNVVAIVGASERVGVGRTLVENMHHPDFKGEIYPISLKRETILGHKAYKTVGDCPKIPDLVIIAIRAKFVPACVKECCDLGVKGLVIISAGFKEMGPPGIALEDEILKHIKKSGTRLVGPNVLGVMTPNFGLNATFAACMGNKGHMCFLSQSGAMCTAMLDWSELTGLGFSAFVSVGSMLDVDWGDLIRYFGDDKDTNAIICYVEGIGDAASFFNAAREVAP